MMDRTERERVPDDPIPTERSPESEKKKHRQEKLDEALEESFPASDPVSMTNPSVPRSDEKPRDGKEKKKKRE
ncbi:MAG: hypothetical protein AB7U38_09705 [Hyphomicrobiales bacterium]